MSAAIERGAGMTGPRDDAAATARSVRYALRSLVSTRPTYVTFASRTRHRDESIGRGTDIVIDGFPRCANTFAAIAFQLAQREPVRIAHHLHAPAHLGAAVHAGVPTIVLVREPIAAVSSEVIRERPVRVDTVLSAYGRFYEHVLPYLDRATVGEFGLVTTAFGRVIGSLNERCGTTFDPFDHVERNVRLVFALIDERERRPERKHVDRFIAGDAPLRDVVEAALALDRDGTPAAEAEHAVPRPSSHRDEMQRVIRRQIESRHLRPALRRAQRVYERVASS
jgi:hypothetical protein